MDDHNTSNRQLDFNVGHNETNEIASSENDIPSCVVSEEGPPFGVDSPGCSTTPLHNNGVLTPGGETADASNKRKSKVIVSESSRSPSPIPQDNNQGRHDCVCTSVDPGSRDCGNGGPGKRVRGVRTRGGRCRGVRSRGGGRRGRPRGSRSGRGRGRGTREQLDLGIRGDVDELSQSEGDSEGEGNEGLKWDGTPRAYREFPFLGLPGVNIFLEDSTCSLDTLKLFLTDELIENLVTYTNSYADIMINTTRIQERMNKQNRNIFNLWKPVTFDEIWTYIAISSLMGIIGKPKYDLYWSKDSFISTPIFIRLMRRDRSTQIRKMIHFTDPAEEDPEDDMRKLSSFLDSLQDSFKHVYTPEQNVAVDEYLSLGKGRLKFRVYIPNTRERYGVKVYMLCESSSAYLYSFKIYSESSTSYPKPTGVEFPKPYKDDSVYSKVVLSLMDGFYNLGYCVTLDNLYTEPYLLLVLYANNTDGFGTLRKKSGLPADFWSWKPQKGLGIPPIIQYHDEKLLILRWNDCYKTKSNKIVSMMSTRHVGGIVGTGKIHFSSKEETRRYQRL